MDKMLQGFMLGLDCAIKVSAMKVMATALHWSLPYMQSPGMCTA
jgi:hypothetical protein